MNHPVDVNKMVCRHAPVEPAVATRSVCEVCRERIEPILCEECGGDGHVDRYPCAECGATGNRGWREAR